MTELFVFRKPSLRDRYLLISTIIITYCVVISDQETYNYKIMEIVDDLPVEEDLNKYLNSLKRIVLFINKHRYYVDIDLGLGVYVMNVYLKTMMLSKPHYLCCEKLKDIKRIIKMNEDVLNEFIKTSKSRSGRNTIPDVLVNMLNVKNGKVTWPFVTQKLNTELLNSTTFYTRRLLEDVYFRWPQYKQAVYDEKTGYSVLGECLNLIAQNPVNNFKEFIYCQVSYKCLEFIKNGVDYGYEVIHRYWRNCIISTGDKDIIDLSCAKMYNELEYIAYHGFELPDLFLDHVALCSFDGHAQFLRRSWLDEFLELQTRYGCFNLTKPSAGSALIVALFQNISEKGDLMVWGESCNAHFTGAAGVTLAAAIRFIFETGMGKDSK